MNLKADAANDVPIAPSGLELWIGGDDLGNATDHFPGKIDEVRLYEKTLSEDDIQKVMETPQDVEARGKLTTTWGKLKVGVEIATPQFLLDNFPDTQYGEQREVWKQEWSEQRGSIEESVYSLHRWHLQICCEVKEEPSDPNNEVNP